MSRLEPFVVGDTPPSSHYEKDLERELDRFAAKVVDLLNGGLTFKDNFNCQVVTIVTPATPGEELAIPHTLKRIPVGCFPIEKNKGGSVYLGPTGKTQSEYNIVSTEGLMTVTLVIL